MPHLTELFSAPVYGDGITGDVLIDRRPVAKALSEPVEYADPAPYGFCPECREPGVASNRSPHPNSRAWCGNGHEYDRRKAKYASTQVEITGAARRKLLAMGRKIDDADLGQDGREEEPHCTARFGLHVLDAAPVASLVAGFGPVELRIGKLAAFRGADSGKDYDVIYAEVDSPDLHTLHELLGELPHTDTHPRFVPHCCVAYLKAGLADKYLTTLGSVDETVSADALTFSTAKREQTEIPLASEPGE